MTTPAQATLAAVLILPSLAMAEEIWKTTGLDTPESVVRDIGREILYVSNIAGDLAAKDGNGYLSILDSDGTIRVGGGSPASTLRRGSCSTAISSMSATSTG
jgi:hypothetical protein